MNIAAGAHWARLLVCVVLMAFAEYYTREEKPIYRWLTISICGAATVFFAWDVIMEIRV